MDYKTIELTKGKETIVDDDDWIRLLKYNWHYHSAGYAVGGGNYYGKNKIPQTYMHRLITGAKKGEEVDHINGNKLDNRKGNLRIVTKSENAMNKSISTKNNTSGFKGVSFYKRLSKWQAYVHKNGKCICLGYFETREQAAKAYDIAAKEYYGEYARLNYA